MSVGCTRPTPRAARGRGRSWTARGRGERACELRAELDVPEPSRDPGEARRRRASGTAGGRGAGPGPALHAAVADELRRRHRVLSPRLVLDEVQPQGRRDGRRGTRGSRGCTRCSRTRRPRARWRCSGGWSGALCEITGMARATLQPPAGASGELTGLLIMRAYHTERGDPRRNGLDPRLGARHEPGERHARGLPGGPGAVRRPRAWSTWTRSTGWSTTTSRA